MSIHTDPASEQMAADRMKRDDWDADGVASVHLPLDVAERLLAERGWNARYSDGRVLGWISPRGVAYWHTSEALAIALIAENE